MVKSVAKPMFAVRKQITKLYAKVRHRRGHGIHSPFVYHFVTCVVENKHTFYAYQDVEHYLWKHFGKRQKIKKIHRFLFRVSLHFRAQNILQIGVGSGVESLCLLATGNNVRLVCVEPSLTRQTQVQPLLSPYHRRITWHNQLPTDFAHEYDLIYLDFNTFEGDVSTLVERLSECVHQHSVIILHNIRTNLRVYSLVEQMRKLPQVRVSMDMYKVAVLCFNSKYFKQHYLLSY